MGCKRIVVDPDYLKSLQRPNLDLEWDPIVEITETGIIVKSGMSLFLILYQPYRFIIYYTGKTYDFDIICYATGFDVAGSSSIDVRGIGGKSLLNYYKEEGGPTAYMGTTTPGFPNWFTLLGPNTVTGEFPRLEALGRLSSTELLCRPCLGHLFGGNPGLWLLWGRLFMTLTATLRLITPCS